jgi:hypothetical protein
VERLRVWQQEHPTRVYEHGIYPPEIQHVGHPTDSEVREVPANAPPSGGGFERGAIRAGLACRLGL